MTSPSPRYRRGGVGTFHPLEELPERCPVIPEHAEFPFEIRHLLYFSHRIVFRVDTAVERVVVYRIYHGSQQRLATEDIP